MQITIEDLKKPEVQELYKERAVNLRVEKIISQLTKSKKEKLEEVAKRLKKEGGARQMLRENLEGRFKSYFLQKFEEIKKGEIGKMADFEKDLNEELDRTEKDMLKIRA